MTNENKGGCPLFDAGVTPAMQKPWLEVDMEEPVGISKVVVHQGTSDTWRRILAWSLQASQDGASFHVMASGKENPKVGPEADPAVQNSFEATFPQTAARYWRCCI